jgi:hypothetical protein
MRARATIAIAIQRTKNDEVKILRGTEAPEKWQCHDARERDQPDREARAGVLAAHEAQKQPRTESDEQTFGE